MDGAMCVDSRFNSHVGIGSSGHDFVGALFINCIISDTVAGWKAAKVPDIRQKCGNEFVFQQDDAPSHRAKLTVEFLQQNVPDFIEPSVWPPNSPDLNPVDYAVWDALQQAMYRYPNPIVSLNDLKDRVRT